MAWGTEVEVERRRRIILSITAYAYEVMNVSLVSDADFDAECLKVDLSIDTENAEMDVWFRKWFQPHTGMWIRNHPHLGRIHQLAKEHFL